MKIDDYKNLVTEIVTKPDEAAEKGQQILEMLQNDSDSFESLETKVKEQDEKIRSLQDTNTKLFLSRTGQKKDDDDDEPELTIHDYARMLRGEE